MGGAGEGGKIEGKVGVDYGEIGVLVQLMNHCKISKCTNFENTDIKNEVYVSTQPVQNFNTEASNTDMLHLLNSIFFIDDTW